MRLHKDAAPNGNGRNNADWQNKAIDRKGAGDGRPVLPVHWMLLDAKRFDGCGRIREVESVRIVKTKPCCINATETADSGRAGLDPGRWDLA
jgi:hypothetical protein